MSLTPLTRLALTCHRLQRWGLVLIIALVAFLPAIAHAERVITEQDGKITQAERRTGDTYEVEANAGDLLALDLIAYEFSAMLEVTCPEIPNQVWRNEVYLGQLHRSALAVIVPRAGTYRVKVKQADSPQGGAYSLTVDQYTGTLQETPALDIRNGALTADDETLPGGEYIDHYTLQVQPGELLRLTAASTGFNQVVVVKSTATGDQWEFAPNRIHPGEELLVAIGDTTEVDIWVTTNMSEQPGEYSLTVQRGTYDDSLGSFVMNTRLERGPSDREECPQFGPPTTEFNEEATPTVADMLQRASLPNYECCHGYRPFVVDFNEDGYHDFITRDHDGMIQLSVCRVIKAQKTYTQYPSWRGLRDTNDDPIRLGWVEVKNRWRRANPSPFPQDCDPVHLETKIDTIALTDYDSDGDLDLLLGSDKGGIYLRRNVGTRKVPVYAATNEILLSVDGQPLSTGGQHPVIDAGDVDGDGRIDLIGAARDGAIVWFQNLTKDDMVDPIYAPGEVLVAELGVFFPFGVGYSRVELADYNKDGKLDISVCGWQGLNWVCLQQ